MKSSTPMLLVYDGPALDKHRIPVQTLAQSLTALNRIAETANEIIFADKSKVSLSVTTFKKGSFGVELVLDSSIFDTVVDILSGKSASAMSNGIPISSCLLELFALKKWLKGREMTKVEPVPDKEQKAIYVDNEFIIVNNTTYVVFQDASVKRDCSEFVSPLKNEGITSIQLSDKKSAFNITSEEVADFIKEPDEQLLTENHVSVWVQVESPYFKQGRKWRVLYNGQSIMVTVLDQDFISRVLRHEATFSTGDMLNCELTIKQILKDGMLSSSYELNKVKAHKAPPYQPSFNL